MTARHYPICLAACLLLLAAATQARAQDAFCGPGCDFDMQMFAPVDFNYNCMPIRKDCGAFFNYERVAWYGTGERHELGLAGGTANGSYNPYRVFTTGQGIIGGVPTIGTIVDIPIPYRSNNIQSAAPRAHMGWGNRYEAGWFKGGDAWMIGVLDGPRIHSTQSFGFGYTPQDNTVAGGQGLPSDIPNSGTNQLLSPFGSVHIVFADPQNLMLGFIDVVDGETSGVPGNILNNDSNGDGVLDGDGFADDIDRDGQFGPDGYDLEDPFEVPDNGLVGSQPADYDDLVILPISWQSIQLRNLTRITGVELMRTHDLSNRHKMAKNQNSKMVLGYGVRFYQLDDNFRVDGQGGVMGDSFWDTTVVNNIVGPQVSMSYMRQRGRFLYDFNGRFLFGYNVQNMKQNVGLGEDLVYAQHNHPLNLHPTYANHGRQEEDFAPLVEIRANVSYQITGSIALKLGYTGTFVDNIRRSSQQVKYELPRMGFRDGAGTQNIYVNGVNFGVDATY